MVATNLTPCGEIVRNWDRERFLCLLFAPEAVREDLFTLYAFNHEVAKTREVTSEHTLGLIRLEWWRESVKSAYTDQPRLHEVVTPLAEAISKFDLKPDELMALIDARARDLDEEIRFSTDDLISYSDATSGQLALIAAKVLGVADQETLGAVKLIARAWGVLGIVRATGFLASDGLNYLPHDLEAGDEVNARDYRALTDHQGLRDVCRELSGLIQAWQNEARRAPGRDVRKALPILLQSRLINGQLKTLARTGYNPFDPANIAPRPLRIVSLYWGSMTGSF